MTDDYSPTGGTSHVHMPRMAFYGSSTEQIRRIRWALDSSPPEFSPKSNEPRAAPSARTVGGRV